MPEKEGEGEEVSFIAQARSGGGKGTSILITVPRDVTNLMEIKQGDYLKLTVKKVKK